MGVALVALVAGAMSACGLGRPPSDGAMIAHFERQRAAFDDIVTMMAEDQLSGELAVDAMPGDSPDRTARRERYRTLLQRTGCRSIGRTKAGTVTFDVWYLTSGGSVAGTGWKGYVYAPIAPVPIRSTLDDDPGRRFEDNFRHVDGAWYLYRAYV
jgi:hypothetical protein